MSYAFFGCFAFEGQGLDAWDTSNVRDMLGMFMNAPSFNGDLTHWNVKRVKTMSKLFREATCFNGDLSRWDVSSVTDMSQIVSALVASLQAIALDRSDPHCS
jgi:surface protein